MNAKWMMRWVIVLLLLAALPVMTAVKAQGKQPAMEPPDVSAQLEPAAKISWVDDESEPNNSMATADDVWWVSPTNSNFVLGGKIGSAGDVDYWGITWYKGYAAEQVGETHLSVLIDVDARNIESPLDPVICLYADDGVEVGCNDNAIALDSMLFFTFEVNRTYYLRVTSVNGAGGNNYKYQLFVSSPLLISAAAGGLGTGYVDGTTFQAGDILAHSDFSQGGVQQQKWNMFLDISHLGVKANVITLSAGWRNSDYLLLGFAGFVTLPGITGQVTPWEIVRFDPSQIGWNSAGTFHRWWDGSTNGLTTWGERIDAIDWLNWTGDVNLLVSTTAAAAVYGGPSNPKLKLADEDGGHWASQGDYWQRPFDGSLWGIQKKDVFALSSNSYGYNLPDDGERWDYNHAVLQGTATLSINGNPVNVTQKDIITFTKYDWYDWNSDPDHGTNYYTSVYWHGPDHGWNYNIDSIDVTSQW